jgi:hypothetical protein
MDMLHVLPLMDRQCVGELQPTVMSQKVQQSLQHVASLNYFGVRQVPGRAIFHAGRQIHATVLTTPHIHVMCLVMLCYVDAIDDVPSIDASDIRYTYEYHSNDECNLVFYLMDSFTINSSSSRTQISLTCKL